MSDSCRQQAVIVVHEADRMVVEERPSPLTIKRGNAGAGRDWLSRHRARATIARRLSLLPQNLLQNTDYRLNPFSISATIYSTAA